MLVDITCSIYPTEDTHLVSTAVKNLFPTADIEVDDNTIHTTLASRDDVEWLRSRIFELRIIDATRSRLQANVRGASTRLLLDKQAALFGRVRIVDDSEESPPLGCIEVSFRFNRLSGLEDFMRWFTPPTENGHVVD